MEVDGLNKDSPGNFLVKSNAQLIKSLAVFFFSTILLFVATVAVTTKNSQNLLSRAALSSTETFPVQPILLEEHFDSAGSLSNWQITQNPSVNNIISIDPLSYKGSGSLLLNYNNYTNAQLVRADKVLAETPVTNLVLRVAFYDDYTPTNPTKGTFFLAVSGDLNTGIGVNAFVSPNNYLFRTNTYTNMKDTGVKRSKGWHIFELVVTDKGTFGKIDNSFLYNSDRTLMVNSTQTNIKMLSLLSTWGLYGKSWFDEVIVAKMDTISAEDQIFRTSKIFYETYKNTDFSPLYPALGTRTHANDLRSLLNTAIIFYQYGMRAGDNTAVSRAVTLFKDALQFGNWNKDDAGKFWARGAYLSQLVAVTNLLKPSLDQATLSSAQNLIYSQVQSYILLQENFNQPLSGWQNLSTSSNEATIVPNIGRDGSSALVLNYRDGTFNSTTGGHNLVNIRKILPVYSISPSLKVKIWFYDDLSPQKGTMFLLASSTSTPNTGIGVNTSISPNNYLFRLNSPSNMQPTGVLRSKGWHQFVLTLSSNSGTKERLGVIGYIDGKKVGVNSTQVIADTVQLVSTWGLTGTSVYDDLLVTRMPDTGKTVDTKGEENAWHALAIAEAVNFFPDIPNRSILSDLADCYAYHSITVSTDSEYCETKTQTAYDDFHFDNHGFTNPTYQAGVMIQLIRGGYSYKAAGAAVPSSFTHNLKSAYQSLVGYIDPAGYQYIKSPPGGWSGATDSPYQSGQPVILYGYKQGWPTPFNVNDFISKRSIEYFNIVSIYLKNSPVSIPTFNQLDKTNLGYLWFLDSVLAEMQLLSGLPSVQ